jgi:hypothetical protein
MVSGKPQTMYAYRFYYGGDQWSFGHPTSRRATAWGKEALQESLDSPGLTLGVCIQKIEHAALRGRSPLVQNKPANIDHANLIDATHAFVRAENWYRACVCASHDTEHLDAAAKARDECFDALVQVSGYTTKLNHGG